MVIAKAAMNHGLDYQVTRAFQESQSKKLADIAKKFDSEYYAAIVVTKPIFPGLNSINIRTFTAS